jgi:hypothetical protein
MSFRPTVRAAEPARAFGLEPVGVDGNIRVSADLREEPDDARPVSFSTAAEKRFRIASWKSFRAAAQCQWYWCTAA